MLLRRPGARPLPALTVLAAALLVSGCAAGPSPEESGPPVIDRQFAHLAGSAPVAEDALFTLATRGDRVVLVGAVMDEVTHLTFRYSDDEGATWTLTDVPEATSTLAAHTQVETFAARPGPDGGWLLLGTGRGRTEGWFSADGATWQRRTLSGLPSEDVDFGAMVGTEQGWVVVGSTQDSRGDSTSAIWRSVDGRSWTEVHAPGPGSLAGAVAHENTIVVAGRREISDPAAERTVDALALHSLDGGATWTEVDLPEAEHDLGVATHLARAERVGDSFVLSGATYQEGDTYAPIVLSSPDGLSWQHRSAPPPGGTFSAATQAAEGGDGLLSVVRTSDAEGRRDDLLVQQAGTWVPSTVPEHGKQLRVDDLGQFGSALLATTYDLKPGLPANALWRSTDGGATFTSVALPPAPSAGGLLEVRDLARVSDGSWLVTGSDQGRDVIWRQSAEGSGFQPLPVADELTSGLPRLATGPGGVVVWNSLDFYENDFGAVWAGPDAGQLKRVHPAQLGGVAPYRWSAVQDVAWIGDRWFLVGERTTNGAVRRSGVVATSRDGRVWRGGVPEKTLARGDSFDELAPLTDLDGLEDRGRSMAAVVDVQGTPLVFGVAYDGENRRPAMWRSPDLSTWSLIDLPAGDLEDVEVLDAGAVGGTVVVHGKGRVAGQDDYLNWAWVSPDAGATWERVPLGSREVTESTAFTATGSSFAFAATGEHGPTVQAWTSADGKTWSELPLDLPTMGPETSYEIADMEADGDGVALLVTVLAPHATRPVLLHQPVS